MLSGGQHLHADKGPQLTLYVIPGLSVAAGGMNILLHAQSVNPTGEHRPYLINCQRASLVKQHHVQSGSSCHLGAV